MNGGEPNARPLIDWLLAAHPETPKTRAKQWILAGRVSVKDEIIRKPQMIIADPGTDLRLLERRTAALDVGPGWQIHPRVSLLYLDSSMAIVNKGPGLVSVPSPNTELSALSILQDFLSGRLKAVNRHKGPKALPAPLRRLTLLPVHRIDQYTSGVLCLAANPAARQNLIEQVRGHTMHREYLAFVQGTPPERKGTWRHNLGLSEDELIQQVITGANAGTGKEKLQEAVTHYEVLEIFRLEKTNQVVSKLLLRLETGLRHQIRVQAAHVGLSLIGDRKYSASSRNQVPFDFPRQALHAASLTLEHPEQSDRILTWHAPMPKDLQQLEQTLRDATQSHQSSGIPLTRSGGTERA